MGADNNDKVPYVCALKFLAKDDGQVSIYDPKDQMKSYPGAVHTLGDGETLIGVYRKKNSFYFDAFGFIVKMPVQK